MRVRNFLLVLVIVLVIGLIWCLLRPTIKPARTVVMIPAGDNTMLYGSIGDTLEFRKTGIGPDEGYIVRFENRIYPCKEDNPIKGTGSKPAVCTVVRGKGQYFSYHYENPKLAPPPKLLQAKGCPYCDIAIDPSNDLIISMGLVKMNGVDRGNFGVECVDNKVYVHNAPDSLTDSDVIAWHMYAGETGLKVSAKNVCSGSPTNDGVFTQNQKCEAHQLSSDHTYTVSLDNCTYTTLSLTVNPKSANQ